MEYLYTIFLVLFFIGLFFLFEYLSERIRARAWRRSFGPDTGRKH